MTTPEIVSALDEITRCRGYRCGDYSAFPYANGPGSIGEFTGWYVAGPGVARSFYGPEAHGDAVAYLRTCADAAEHRSTCERIAAEHGGYAADSRERGDDPRPHDDEAARHRREAANALSPHGLDRRAAESLRMAAVYAAASGKPETANDLHQQSKRFRDSLVRRTIRRDAVSG